MQGAWLTPEAVPSERERNGRNGECKAELECSSGDEETNFERRMLVTAGGPENWKDKLRRILPNGASSLYGESIGRGDWILDTFRVWNRLQCRERRPPERIQI